MYRRLLLAVFGGLLVFAGLAVPEASDLWGPPSPDEAPRRAAARRAVALVCIAAGALLCGLALLGTAAKRRDVAWDIGGHRIRTDAA